MFIKHLSAKINHAKKRVIRRLQRELELDRISDNLMTVLDSAVDITQCRPATGKMRDIQLADTELLRLFALLCEKNGLTYWLDWGTLLGAVRHKGFIPWDDDLDVSMPREDFVRSIPIIADFFAGREGFAVCGSESAIKNDRMWICYWNASVLIDIFPIDSVAVEKDASEDAIALRVVSCRNGVDATTMDGASKTPEQLDEIYYYASNVWDKPGYFKKSAIFPLQKLAFEGYAFSAPKDCDQYLSVEYGNYMAFPRNGILHHSGLTENETYSPAALQTAVKEIKTIQQELLNQNG